ncbi:MAG: tetratricopeptide repeat protein [Desulfosarcina sp.]|nr:tetratricopeptide repeat protein [Desulfobacterales bacterium]
MKITPDFITAANNLAYLLTEQHKDLNEALKFAQIAKEKLPNDAGVIDTLGWVYYKKGLYDSAISEFSDSLKKNSGNATIHYHLGLAYNKKGKKDLAKRQFEKALDINKNFQEAEQARKLLSEL